MPQSVEIGRGVVVIEFPNGVSVNIRQAEAGCADVIAFCADAGGYYQTNPEYLTAEQLSSYLERIRMLSASGRTAAILAP